MLETEFQKYFRSIISFCPTNANYTCGVSKFFIFTFHSKFNLLDTKNVLLAPRRKYDVPPAPASSGDPKPQYTVKSSKSDSKFFTKRPTQKDTKNKEDTDNQESKKVQNVKANNKPKEVESKINTENRDTNESISDQAQTAVKKQIQQKEEKTKQQSGQEKQGETQAAISKPAVSGADVKANTTTLVRRVIVERYRHTIPHKHLETLSAVTCPNRRLSLVDYNVSRSNLE